MINRKKINEDLQAYYNKAMTRAEELTRVGRERVEPLLEIAREKAAKNRENLKAVWLDFQVLLRMVKSWNNGSYTDIPWKSIVTALGAVVYMVNPMDLIPDFLAIAGFLDDATVIGLAIKSLRDDIHRYLEWENKYEELESDLEQHNKKGD